jgi:hypothetical protein
MKLLKFMLVVSFTDCEQMEHSPDWSDDILPRGSGQHSGVIGPVSEV